MTKIKICGLTSVEDAELINELKTDYAGIVMFFPKSHRNVSAEAAKKITAAISDNIKKTAVVVSPTLEQIKEIESCGFDIIQIHGEISESVLSAATLPIFKAFNVKDIDELDKYSKYDNIIGYVFDAAQPGSGKTFDWSVLKRLDTKGKLLILAGGLNPDNVSDAIAYLRPDAVDVSTGVENDNGNGKSREKAVSFVNAVRASR